jgi:hypothetical protein
MPSFDLILIIIFCVLIGCPIITCIGLLIMKWRQNKKDTIPEYNYGSSSESIATSSTTSNRNRSISYSIDDNISDISFANEDTSLLSDNNLDSSTGSTESKQREFLEYFRRVMQPGIVVILHTAKRGSKAIKLRLEGNDLLWQSNKPNPKKKFRLKLTDILRVEKGKYTPNFSASSASKVDASLCFSLITANSTIDLQTSSALERDAMAKALELLLNEAIMSSRKHWFQTGRGNNIL